MDKESILNKIKEIGSIDDEVERRDKLTELTDEVSNMCDTYESTINEDKKLKEDNEKLIEYNRKLFMKVGFDKDQKEVIKETTGEDIKEPRKFEELFDEKGNLK